MRDVYLPTRLRLFSGQCLPGLAWSAMGRVLNGQSRVQSCSAFVPLLSSDEIRSNKLTIPGAMFQRWYPDLQLEEEPLVA
jgi:hypothetical protein